MLSRRLLRIKVLKALFAHIKSGSDSMIASEKNLMASVNKAYDLYFQMLTLPVELVNYAHQRQDLAKQKRLPTAEDLNPNTKFVDNIILSMIADSDSVNDHIAANGLGWSQHTDLIRILYNRMVQSEYYQKYMSSTERTFDGDKAFVEEFFRDIQHSEELDDALEEMSVMWCDDMPYILMMISRTISGIRTSHNDIRIASQYKSEEDPEFVKILFEKTLIDYDKTQEYIEKFTSNWDVERIVFMDNLIIATAMTELLQFPSIPVKVTLDEFIEISKYYSTPGSSTFINGVLDKIVESLNAEDRIRKAGRGLI